MTIEDPLSLSISAEKKGITHSTPEVHWNYILNFVWLNTDQMHTAFGH